MKPGSLVVLKFRNPKMLGIVIRENKESNTWGDRDPPYRWWEVYSDNKIIIVINTSLTPI